MIAAVTLLVPLADRYVTILVSRDPVCAEARAAFVESRGLDAFMKRTAKADWATFEAEVANGAATGSDGFCMHDGPLGARIVIWVNDFRAGLLAHETSHAADAILESTGIGDNTEARARINEFITRESINGLREYDKRDRARKEGKHGLGKENAHAGIGKGNVRRQDEGVAAVGAVETAVKGHADRGRAKAPASC